MHCANCNNNLDHLLPMVVQHALEHEDLFSRRCILVNGPVIVGAGPSGLAVGAGLQQQGVPFVILDRADCIASLWQNKTYDRLKLHLPKQFCQLPYFPFPPNFPEYPSKYQFIDYLESYAKKFEIRPRFNEAVQSAKYDETCGLWRVRTVGSNGEVEYICRWLVVATGENAEKVVPDFQGLDQFGGHLMHACDYRSGEAFEGKRVLVVGCGNSGMEVSLDLCHHNASPSMVVRNSVHVLPREIAGKSTFELATSLMKWLPVKMVDKILLAVARLKLGNLEKYGLKRPSMGPLQLKNSEGKTPVLDIGALQKIKSGKIQIVPGIKKFSQGRVELVNGQNLEIDSVILATGYRSNVPSWLKVGDVDSCDSYGSWVPCRFSVPDFLCYKILFTDQENDFFSREGMPMMPFPEGWKGKAGLYAVGFTRRGLSGASLDAMRVSQDIGKMWNQETKKMSHYVTISCDRRCNKYQNEK